MELIEADVWQTREKINRRAFGDAHKIITFYTFISLSCLALAIFSPRFTEILTDGCETPSFLDNSVVLKPSFLTAQ